MGEARVRGHLAGLAEALTVVVGCVATALTAGGFFGGYSWILDLVSHFRIQLLLVSSLAAVVAFALGQRLPATVFLLVAAANTAVIAPFWLPRLAVSDGETLRVGTLNLDAANDRSDLVLEELERAQLDVVVLHEFTFRWQEALGNVPEFQTVVSAPRDSPFGMAILSKITPLEVGETQLANAGGTVLTARFGLDGRPLQVLGLHPFPPLRAGGTALRDSQLHAAARFVLATDVPTIILGDLNSSPWSHGFRLVTASTALRSASQGHGLAGTWPTDNAALRVPIDHILVPGSIAVTDFERGRFVGSDHFPIWAEVGWDSGPLTEER